MNAELVSLAMALNGDKQILFLGTKNSKKIEVTYMAFMDTLMMHYPIEGRNLKQLELMILPEDHDRCIRMH